MSSEVSNLRQPLITMSTGDIHWGACDPIRLFNEFQIGFIDFIDQNVNLGINLIVIDGDYFDKKLYASDSWYQKAIESFTNLFNKCSQYGIQLRMLRGTVTHDLNQQHVFKNFEGAGSVFKFYDTVTVEVIHGNKVLFVPEEYPENMQEYYADTIFNVADNEYHAMFLHGTLDFQAWQCQVIESEKHYSSAPVFKADDLMRVCSGPVQCGHIHVSVSLKDQIYYHGSFTRTGYNEEQDKGFLLAAIDSEGYEVQFIKNELAPSMNTVLINYIISATGSDVESIIKYIDNLSDPLRDNLDKLRVIIPHTFEDRALVNTLIAYFQTSSKVDIVQKRVSMVKSVNEAINSAQPTDNESEELFEETSEEESVNNLGAYSYLLEGHADPIKTISRFISDRSNGQITLSEEKINSIISGE